MWRLDHEEDWVPKNWCFLESPLGSKEIEQVNPKGINPEYSLEELMLKLKLQYFAHLKQRADSLKKTLMLGKIEGKRWRRREDKMVGWHDRLNGHEFEQTQGDSEGKGSLACYTPWGCKELDWTTTTTRMTKFWILAGSCWALSIILIYTMINRKKK